MVRRIKVILVLVPLIILFGISVFVMAGFNPNTDSVEYANGIYYNPNADWGGKGYSDDTGHQVCDENGTATGEPGKLIRATYTQEGDLTGTVFIANDWQNETGTYPLTKEDVFVSGLDEAIGYDLAGSVGLIGIIGGLMLVATVAGVTVFGTGENTKSISVIITGTGLIALFAVASLFSMDLLVFHIPTFGPMLFFGMTIMYTIGSVFMISGGSED